MYYQCKAKPAGILVKFPHGIADFLCMDFLAAGLSSLINIFLLALFMAGVMKLFQIHTTLTEIKDALRAGSVSTRTPAPSNYVAPTPLHEMRSGEDMLRALDAQMHLEEHARDPEIVEPR
jgi:riboflavin transporter FmnP